MNWISTETQKPPKNTLVLAWYDGAEGHSGASFVRQGYGFAAWHDNGWSRYWMDEAKQRLGADWLDVTYWCELVTPLHRWRKPNES